MVSTAAGMMVTKAGVHGATEKALFRQVGGQPRAMGMSSFLLLGLAVMPGIPAVPFLTLSALTAIAAFATNRSIKKEVEQVEAEAQQMEEEQDCVRK